jgi:hypothetical protein
VREISAFEATDIATARLARRNRAKLIDLSIVNATGFCSEYERPRNGKKERTAAAIPRMFCRSLGGID